MSGGGQQVAQQMTAIEVKHEALRAQHTKDMSGLVELRLRCAEAEARAADLEAAQSGRRGTPR